MVICKIEKKNLVKSKKKKIMGQLSENLKKKPRHSVVSLVEFAALITLEILGGIVLNRMCHIIGRYLISHKNGPGLFNKNK